MDRNAQPVASVMRTWSTCRWLRLVDVAEVVVVVCTVNAVDVVGGVDCYVPGHLAHIFLSFLDRYVLIQSHDLDSHDCLPVQQSHLAGNSIVPFLCTLFIVLFLW